MIVHSDILTTDDLYACLPDGVSIAALRKLRNPRKRANGWELSLEGISTRHTRRRNSGMYGADGYGYAATWDDHGVWMAALYEIDPDACIAWYTGRSDFYEKTRHDFHWRQRSRFTSVRDNAQAPWLHAEAIRRERVTA